MPSHIVAAFVGLFSLIPIAQPFPQEGADADVDRSRGERADPEDERSRSERRRERQERWQSYREATPEQRVQMRSERWVGIATRVYDLDETQQQAVRLEVQAMETERRAVMGADADRYDALRDKMFEFWGRRSETEGDGANRDDEGRRDRWRRMREDPAWRELREEMRTIEEKYPFNFETAAARVEALLPPDQAERGRERRQERMSRWERRGDDRRRDGDRRDRDRPPRPEDRRQDAAATNPNSSAPPVAVQPASAVAPALHPWEVHVRSFIEEHQLSEAQSTAAMALLKELRTRASQIELAQADRIHEAERLPDPAARKKRLAELRQPVDDLYKELQRRLDGLLTASQRAPMIP